MASRIFTLTVLVAWCYPALCTELSPADSLRSELFRVEDELWRNVSDNAWSESVALGADVEVTKAFQRLDERIQRVPHPSTPPLQHSWLWLKTVEKLRIIDGVYKTFVDFTRRQAAPGSVPAPVREWLDLTENVLMDPESSVKQAVKKLGNVFDMGNPFTQATQDYPDRCDLQMSTHQIIYDMYNTIALTEIKGYAMMQFSWMLLRIYGKGNFTQEASMTRHRYGVRSAKTAMAAKAALSGASRDVYRCDPPHHEEGVTYAQVTRLLQGYVENEVDMNEEGSCRENCAFYTLAKHRGCFKDQYCSRQPTCKGRIVNCQYIDSDMWICPASYTSSRRYEYIEYENGRKLGQTGSCRRGVTKVDSWWRWLFWHCSYCMCLCDEPGVTSHRYFSLRESAADHAGNKVVTGVRLVKLGRVFHLQVSEGILGPRGNVTPGGWVPVQQFDPTDHGILEDIHYHTLTYERRGIDLDELDSPEGHVLTGVRFRMIGAHIHFEIHTTPFNYTTGRLSPMRGQWISNDNTEGGDNPRSALRLVQPDIPTRSKTPLHIDSKHDQYVEFTHSDFEADAAQSTVPFIDIQPVQPLRGGELVSGAGLVHRGIRGSGGFIAVKLITYDYTRHVQADAPPQRDSFEHVQDFVPVVN